MSVSTFERRRMRVYVAGPISSDPMVGIHRAFVASRQMFLDGLAPFIPHADAFWFLPDGHWNSYLEYDAEFVSVCEAVYRLDGESRGADLEVTWAREHGIPVFYEDDPDGYSGLLSFAASKGLTGVRV